MTLVEVLVALAILGIVILGMGRYAVGFARTVSEANIRSIASDLVADRIETVKSYGRYATLETTYAGTETSIPGYRGYARTTRILRVGGTPRDSVDYKVVTVSVTGPQFATPVKKSTVIPSF
jgi:prepilin-type N-terminal cleavage/methylation domain-containing protein